MQTLQVHVWAENASVGVSQWAAETMGIWQDKGGLPTQQIDNKASERVWEITQFMRIINKQGAGPKEWDLVIDCCVTQSVIWCLKGCFGNGTWQTRLTSIVRNTRQHWTSSLRLSFAEGRIGLKKPGQEEETCALWYVFHHPDAFVALPDDV